MKKIVESIKKTLLSFNRKTRNLVKFVCDLFKKFIDKIKKIFAQKIKKNQKPKFKVFKFGKLKKGVINGLIYFDDGSIMTGYFEMRNLDKQNLRNTRVFAEKEHQLPKQLD